MAAAEPTCEGRAGSAAMSCVELPCVDTAAVRVTREGDPGDAAVPGCDRTTAARSARGSNPGHAVVPRVGRAAAEVAQQDEPRSAAVPVIRMAAARGIRE